MGSVLLAVDTLAGQRGNGRCLGPICRQYGRLEDVAIHGAAVTKLRSQCRDVGIDRRRVDRGRDGKFTMLFGGRLAECVGALPNDFTVRRNSR